MIFFLRVTNTQAKQQKSENQEKKLQDVYLNLNSRAQLWRLTAEKDLVTQFGTSLADQVLILFTNYNFLFIFVC